MNQILQAGDLAADRFEILRLIAEGGMGQVYEARDRTLGGLVALKLLNYPNIDDEVVNRRFRREIQLARQVTHPNVCRLYDVYQHRITHGLRSNLDVTLVTMELLSGSTLEETLADRRHLKEAEALPLVRQMADALDAAHDVGIIHRDFKPSNVMLVQRETHLRAVVTDFGLARSTARGPTSTSSPLTGEMKVVGTADYMSPEQLRGTDVGPASDIYAFGVVIFEMVTGKRPYSAANTLMLLTQRATTPPSSPLDHRSDLDPLWAKVILRCMDDDPEKRPASAGDVARLLASEKRMDSDIQPANDKSSRLGLAPGLLIALLTLGLMAILALRQNPHELIYGQGVQLTTSDGLELDPAFSPDGSKIVYSSNESGSFEIHVRELRPGGTTRRLTEDGGLNFEPVFSPDGESLVYHSAQRGGLWEIPASGGAAKQLTNEGSRPAFSPDGIFLAFQSESAPLVSDNVLPALGNTTLWLFDLENRSQRQLTRAGDPLGGHGSPSWSPDGEHIVFSATQRQTSSLWSIDQEGKNLVLLVSDPSPAYDPVFSPDGHHLYFSGATPQGYSLWSQPLSRKGRSEGPPQEILNLGLASVRLSAFSPDGSKLAYTTLWTQSNLLSVPIGADGGARGEPRALTQKHSRNTRPAFSPDGSQVAWEQWTRGGNRDIWIMQANGRQATQLTVDQAKEGLPSWHDEGRRISFLRRSDDAYQLLAIDLKNRREEQLAVLADDADWARLSPDGKRVAFHSKADGETTHVRLLDLATGDSRVVFQSRDLTGFPCWSPDSRYLVIQARRGEHHQMMLLSSHEGEDAILLSDRDAHHYPFSFSPDSRQIAFASDRDGHWNLWTLDREDLTERPLTHLKLMGGYVRYPTWSPRNDQVIFELVESSGDLWIAELETP